MIRIMFSKIQKTIQRLKNITMKGRMIELVVRRRKDKRQEPRKMTLLVLKGTILGYSFFILNVVC